MISVALCTYNGAHFIREQLESIFKQTLPVDEIVVCDDGSTDETLSIIESLCRGTAIGIRIYRNEANLGVCASFQKAVDLCRGDIVFLSDQDDLWHPDKVRIIIEYFEKNKDKQIVFSDGQLINDHGVMIDNKTLWDTVGFTPRAQKALTNGFGPELFSYENRVTGATMAVRRSFLEGIRFLDICNDTILHDGALAMLGTATKTLGYISKPLIDYRIHSGQKVGIGEALHFSLGDDARAASPLCEQWYLMTLPPPLKERIAFIRARHRRKHQPLGIFRMMVSIGGYCKYYRSKWFSFFFFDIKQWFVVMWRRFFNRQCPPSQS